MKKILKIIILVFLSFNIYSINYGNENVILNDEFTGLYNQMLMNNPELGSLKKNIKAHKLQKVSNLFLPDPMVEGMIGKLNTRLTISQPLMDPSLYVARYKMENADEELSRSIYNTKEGALLFQLKKEYLMYYNILR